MEITYKDIENANKQLTGTDIKGKSYIEVNQRIKAFRMVYPEGYIITKDKQIIGDECHITKECGYYLENKKTGEMQKIVLAEGEAYEKIGSSFINKTSYVENCDTSAVGRALGMAGFGIDTSISSLEEMQNAEIQQDELISEEKIGQKEMQILEATVKKYNKNETEVAEILTKYGYKSFTEVKKKDYAKIGNELSK